MQKYNPWALVFSHHTFLLRKHIFLSPGPFVASEVHLQDWASWWREMSSRRLGCVFASGGNMTCRRKGSKGKEFNCSRCPEGPEALLPPLPASTLSRSPCSVLSPLPTWVLPPLQQEKGMAIHSSTLAWRIPWTEAAGRLQSMGPQEPDTTEGLSHRHWTSPWLRVLYLWFSAKLMFLLTMFFWLLPFSPHLV